ncbi:CRISPR system Cms endoribonuclease Csm3 [Methanocaldococcus lauensis]|nr:CRISPR system Cms endoribonuclease Csm3 [Methanocaldococcus lauensis]
MVFGDNTNNIPKVSEDSQDNRILLKGKVILEGIVELQTGIHIGGNKETLKIGGTDNPVIKDANGLIYIPGSSLKGKIRSLLEKVYGTYKIDNDTKNRIPKNNGEPCECGQCDICQLFGPHNSNNIIKPPRVVVRDAYLVKKENNELVKLKEINDYLEIKPENMIDRLKGTAKHPRFTERVVKGSRFKFEVVFNIYEKNDKELIKKFIEGMKLLEDDYLGGSGSRGYGKIKFKELKLINRPKKYYEGNANEIIMPNKPTDNLDELIKILDNDLDKKDDNDNNFWIYDQNDLNDN